MEVRTEYRTEVVRDSVWIDRTDTVRIVERGDTVKVEQVRYVREYKYLMMHDTVMKRDTLTVEKVTTSVAAVPADAKVYKMKANRWKWFGAGFGVCFILIFAARILIRIYLKK